MLLIRRRRIFAAAGTLAAALTARKPQAAVLHDLGADLVPTNPPAPPPDISFTTPDGAEHHLTDFAGHGMVVNLWATWCVPCVEEMPSLAALSKTLAPDDIAVLPLSSDRGGARVVEAFYQEHGITGLPVLLDSKGTAARAWRAVQPGPAWNARAPWCLGCFGGAVAGGDDDPGLPPSACDEPAPVASVVQPATASAIAPATASRVRVWSMPPLSGRGRPAPAHTIQTPFSWTTLPSSSIRPPFRRSLTMSQWTADSFVPPMSANPNPSAMCTVPSIFSSK